MATKNRTNLPDMVRIHKQMLVEFPAFPLPWDVLARVMRLAKEAAETEAAETAETQPEIVRILRIYSFEGPRAKVEDQVARSIHGTKEWGNGVKINAATIGAFPEIMAAPPAEEPQV